MIRTTKEERSRWIDEYLSSGMPVHQFCNERGLSSCNLYNWLNKSRHAAESKGNFVEVIPKARSEQATYEIQYPNGVELKVKCHISIKELLELIGKC